MKNKTIKLIAVASGFAMPFMAFAQQTATGILNIVQGLLNTIIPVLITAAVVYFIIGVIGYVMGKSDEAKKEGKQRIIWGLVGAAVILGFWGIVNILLNTFGLTNKNAPTNSQFPCIPNPALGITC